MYTHVNPQSIPSLTNIHQFCFLYFRHKHCSSLSLPQKHNKHLSKSVSQPKLAKISPLMLMTYQSPLLLSPKKLTKRRGGKRSLRPGLVRHLWIVDPDAASIYGSVHPINVWDLKDPEAPGTKGSMEFQVCPHLSKALFPTSREPPKKVLFPVLEKKTFPPAFHKYI